MLAAICETLKTLKRRPRCQGYFLLFTFLAALCLLASRFRLTCGNRACGCAAFALTDESLMISASSFGGARRLHNDVNSRVPESRCYRQVARKFGKWDTNLRWQ
jgi:hypothetical protein